MKMANGKEGLGIKLMGRKLRVLVLTSLLCSRYSLQRHQRTVMADGHQLESDTFFRMHWNCGRIILQSRNGLFLGIVANGLLMANASIPGESSSPLTGYSSQRCFQRYLEYDRKSTRVEVRRSGSVYLLSHWIFFINPANYHFEPQFHCLHYQWKWGKPACLPALSWELNRFTHLKGRKTSISWAPHYTKCFHKHLAHSRYLLDVKILATAFGN